MAMLRGVPDAKLRVLPVSSVISAPAIVGNTPVAVLEPSTRLALPATVMRWLTVTWPEVALPMLMVPALSVAISALLRLSGPPMGSVVEPRLTPTPAVNGRMLIRPDAGAVIVSVALMAILSPVKPTVPLVANVAILLGPLMVWIP